MPLRGSTHTSGSKDVAPYFKNLAELDEWASSPSAKLTGVPQYQPRTSVEGLLSNDRGKLLVNAKLQVARVDTDAFRGLP